ncbi:phosphate-binding protein PstS 1 precursor [bacterium BMS3Abin06]|nr:phosphate-binding protein PstS 1 precursor [bacterium BMS3Abin06]
MEGVTAGTKPGLSFNRVLRMSVVALALCLFSRFAAAAELTWTGCGITKKAFMVEIAKVYKEKTGIKIRISGGGATRGIRYVSAGYSDMGGSCRHRLFDLTGAIHEEERDTKLIRVAWDALVAVVHKDNPVNNISLDNLKKVYEGKITSWKDLGGKDKRIVLLVRDGKYSGVGHMFRWLVFNDPEYGFKARALIFKSTAPLEKKIEKTLTAFGVTGISSAKKERLKVLSLDGVTPTKENIASGKYPLFRPIYITVKKDSTNPEIKRFIDFILSPEGQAEISAQGTVNLSEGEALIPLWEEKKATLGF